MVMAVRVLVKPPNSDPGLVPFWSRCPNFAKGRSEGSTVRETSLKRQPRRGGVEQLEVSNRHSMMFWF